MRNKIIGAIRAKAQVTAYRPKFDEGGQDHVQDSVHQIR